MIDVNSKYCRDLTRVSLDINLLRATSAVINVGKPKVNIGKILLRNSNSASFALWGAASPLIYLINPKIINVFKTVIIADEYDLR